MRYQTELFSVMCGAFAVCGTLAALLTDCWQINSKGSVVLSIRCRGLWRECVWDSFVKIWTCDQFSSYLNRHPVSVVSTRALLIVSGVLSLLAFLFLLLGFRHFHCCDEEKTQRLLLKLSAGTNFLAGLSSSAGVAQYCIYVFEMHQFEVSLKIPGFPSFEYGYSLWMAAGATLSAISAGALSAYVSCCEKTIIKENSTRCECEEQFLRTYV